MIFSELYSVYYSTVAKIICMALNGDVTEKDLQKRIMEDAFSESFITILPALKSGKWQLFDSNMRPVIKNKPTMPLTTLEKRWLKAILEDARIKLFGASMPGLDDVEPLFTPDDYKLYDKYTDGDPFEDLGYIRNFKIIMGTIKSKKPVEASVYTRNDTVVRTRFYPIGLEYSEKDDKMRVIANGSKFKYFNLGKIVNIRIYTGRKAVNEKTQEDRIKEVAISIKDERNALERAMLHFAHFEKQAERISDKEYVLHIKYYEYDETEIVIRILSFGPFVKVIEPDSFIALIKERLILQKTCKL